MCVLNQNPTYIHDIFKYITYIYTYIYTYIHTYIHTYMHANLYRIVM